MRSLALSLIVALGVTLGTATAFAETTPRGATVATILASAQESMKQANLAAQRAQEHRVAARKDAENAKLALKIAADDQKQGFTYEAGVMREKAAKYQQSAARHLEAAAREEATAAYYRAVAQKQMSQYQQQLGTVAVASR